MSRIHPGPGSRHDRHGASSSCPEPGLSAASAAGTGFCIRCYEHGAFTLVRDVTTAGPPSELCLLHELPGGERAAADSFGIRGGIAPKRTPRGRGARRATGPSSGPGRASRALAPSARVRARGIARARARHDRGFTPHPGWRNFIDHSYRVLTSQPEALEHLARLVDDEDWRTDKRRSWSAILRRLVCHMDWETGLITGLTAGHLAAAGARAARTVSRVLAWAREIGLLVVVEAGASAEFLGTETGRTPTYALVTHTPLPRLDGAQHHEEPGIASAGQSPVEESGDLPTTPVGIKPLTGGRRTHLTSQPKWHPYDVPDTPDARNAATLTLLSHLGLGGRKGGKIEIWRARALLKPWWDAGATVTGLLHALEYHPDRPDHRRGDIASGARDPLRIIGARLRPWHGRLGAIRAVQIGRMRAGTSAKPAAKVDAALLDRPAGRGARRAAQEALSEHLRQLREARGTQPDHHPAAAVLPRRLRRPRIKR